MIDQALKDQVASAVTFGDEEIASKLRRQIRRDLEAGSVAGADRPELERLLTLCEGVNLTALSVDRMYELVEHRVLYVLAEPAIDLKSKLAEWVDRLQMPDVQEQALMRLRQSLEVNDQRLGEEQLTIGGKRVPPTLGSWLRSFSGELKSGGFGTASVLSKSPAASHLSEPQREVLLRAIDLFKTVDQLVAAMEQAVPKNDGTDIPPDMDDTSFVPGLVLEDTDASVPSVASMLQKSSAPIVEPVQPALPVAKAPQQAVVPAPARRPFSSPTPLKMPPLAARPLPRPVGLDMSVPKTPRPTPQPAPVPQPVMPEEVHPLGGGPQSMQSFDLPTAGPGLSFGPVAGHEENHGEHIDRKLEELKRKLSKQS